MNGQPEVALEAELNRDAPVRRGLSLDLWRRLTLARQFTVTAVAASLVSVLLLGTWVHRTLEASIIESAGVASAVYIGHFVAPHLQELASRDTLSPATVRSLDLIQKSIGVNMRLHSIKVWRKDGYIVYSSNKDEIGSIYFHDSLIRAWKGYVTVEFDHLADAENAWMQDGTAPLLEVYTPIYSEDGNDVIAVAEFYEQVGRLSEQLISVRWQTWLVTALLAGAMISALFSIVADGSKTIELQRSALAQRVSELSGLLQQNSALRDRVKRAARQVVEDQERSLRQIGSELHDGPAQLVGLALLRLHQLRGDAGETSSVHHVLSDALDEIRNISSGLLLSEPRDTTLNEAILHTVREHERRTRTTVSFVALDLPSEPPRYVILCLCRVVREGLANAFRHADGKGQMVAVSFTGKMVVVEVCDEGPGITADRMTSCHGRLGLLGLRGRVESIGGVLTVESRPENGTRLMACLPMNEEE